MSNEDCINSGSKKKSQPWILIISIIGVLFAAFVVYPFIHGYLLSQQEWVVDMEGREVFGIYWDPELVPGENITKWLEPIDLQALYEEITLAQGLNTSYNFTLLNYQTMIQDQLDQRHLTDNMSIQYTIEYTNFQNYTYTYNDTWNVWSISPPFSYSFDTAFGLWVNSSFVDPTEIKAHPVSFNQSLVIHLEYLAIRDYSKRFTSNSLSFEELIQCSLSFSDNGILQSVAFIGFSAEFYEMMLI